MVVGSRSVSVFPLGMAMRGISSSQSRVIASSFSLTTKTSLASAELRTLGTRLPTTDWLETYATPFQWFEHERPNPYEDSSRQETKISSTLKKRTNRKSASGCTRRRCGRRRALQRRG